MKAIVPARRRPRAPAGTLQAQCFRVLRDCGSLCADAIAERVGIGRETARKACWYLEQRGCVAKRRVFGRRVFYAAIAGKREPTDRRGKPAGCRNHRGATAWAKWLAMMQRKHGSAWRPPLRGATALELAWALPHARAERADGR